VIDLTSFKAIIFDMDGTLIDSMAAHIDAWEAACEAFGYPFDRDFHYSLGGVPSEATVHLMNQRYAMTHPASEVAHVKKLAFEKQSFLPPVIQDTLLIFNHYKNQMPIAVGTGADREHATVVLNHHGILPQLTTLVTADDVKKGKPDPETFLRAALEMGIEPEKCVVFEDTEMGRQAALDGGMACIMVENGRVVGDIARKS